MERRYQITVCRGPECGDRRGSAAVYQALRERLLARGLAARAQLGWQSCFGRCSQGPNVLVREITEPGPPDPGVEESTAAAPVRATALYNGVDAVSADDVVSQHVGAGVVVRTLVQPPAVIGANRLNRGLSPRSPGSR